MTRYAESMKKLLGIVVLGLLLSGPVVASCSDFLDFSWKFVGKDRVTHVNSSNAHYAEFTFKNTSYKTIRINFVRLTTADGKMNLSEDKLDGNNLHDNLDRDKDIPKLTDIEIDSEDESDIDTPVLEVKGSEVFSAQKNRDIHLTSDQIKKESDHVPESITPHKPETDVVTKKSKRIRSN